MALGQEQPVKVGVLHSLSGTMAIGETTLKVDFAREIADDLLVIDRGRVVVAGARGELDEADVRRYLTI